MKHKYVFTSYSSASKSILEGYDIPCWVTPHNIIQATRECSLMVLIYSENSNSSSQAANEADKAFSHVGHHHLQGRLNLNEQRLQLRPFAQARAGSFSWL